MSVMAVDIGGTNIRVAWYALPKVQVDYIAMPCKELGFPIAVEHFAAFLQIHLQRWESLYGRAKAIGIAAAAVVDYPSGYVRVGENLGWRDVPLRALLEDRLDRPVRIDADAFCGALAEAQLGSGADKEHFLYIVLGTGIGHGLVLHRRVWHGMHGAANIFGHIKTGFRPVPCYCGGIDCLCQYASGQGIGRLAVMEGKEGHVSSAEVVGAYQKNEPWAITVIAEMLDNLSLALSHALNLLDIECVVLGGGVVSAIFPDLRELERRLESLVYPEIRPILVRRAALGDRAVLTGAALLGFDVVNGDAG